MTSDHRPPTTDQGPLRYNSPKPTEATLRFVTPALKHVIFPALSRSGYLRRRASDGAAPAIVTYHGVFPEKYKIRNSPLDGNLVRADALCRQLKLLQDRYHVITPEEFLNWLTAERSAQESSAVGRSLPPRSILLTCDDALRNTLTEMVPVLHERGLSCLFFATGASADQNPSMLWYEELYLMLLDAKQSITLSIPEADVTVPEISPHNTHAAWWNLVERLSPFDRETRSSFLVRIREQLALPETWKDRFLENPVQAARFLMLDQAGLRQLASAGMTIGAHSLSHPILSRASKELAWREISESRGVLEKAVGQPIWAFAYPFGNNATVSIRDLQLAEEAGFHCAFMNTGGGFGAAIHRFALPRVHVTAGMGIAEFEAHISGFYRSLRKQFADGDEQLE